MTTVSHIDRLIESYVLELLPADTRREVEIHAAGCERCRGLLFAERSHARHWTRTLDRTFAPPAGRLQAIWPRVAVAAGIGQPTNAKTAMGWWARWRVATVVFAASLLLLASLLGKAWGVQGWLTITHSPTSPAQAASPTASSTPTWARPSLTVESVAYAYSTHSGVVKADPSAGTAQLTITPISPAGSQVPEPEPVPAAPSSTVH